MWTPDVFSAADVRDLLDRAKVKCAPPSDQAAGAAALWLNRLICSLSTDEPTPRPEVGRDRAKKIAAAAGRLAELLDQHGADALEPGAARSQRDADLIATLPAALADLTRIAEDARQTWAELARGGRNHATGVRTVVWWCAHAYRAATGVAPSAREDGPGVRFIIAVREAARRMHNVTKFPPVTQSGIAAILRQMRATGW